MAATFDGRFRVAVAADSFDADGRIRWDHVVIADGVVIDAGTEELGTATSGQMPHITDEDARIALGSLLDFAAAFAEGELEWTKLHPLYAEWGAHVAELALPFMSDEEVS